MLSREAVVERHESEAGSWENVSVRPAVSLRSFVVGYTAWSSEAPSGAVRRHLPGLRVPLIFMSEPGFEVLADEASAGLSIQRAFTAGLHDSYAVTRSSRSDGGVQVDLTPQGARAVFGLPMHEITGRVFEAEDVLGLEARALAERLRSPVARESHFEAIDAFLECRLAAGSAPDPHVSWAYQRLVRSGGSCRVGALAEAVGWSHRRLVDGFREQVGLAPKTVARVVRFNRALRFAAANPVATWADVASATGYYDQPHLVREFAALSGSTPRDLAARTLPPGGGIQG